MPFPCATTCPDQGFPLASTVRARSNSARPHRSAPRIPWRLKKVARTRPCRSWWRHQSSSAASNHSCQLCSMYRGQDVASQDHDLWAKPLRGPKTMQNDQDCPVGCCLRWTAPPSTSGETKNNSMHEPFPPAQVTSSGAEILPSTASFAIKSPSSQRQVAAATSGSHWFAPRAQIDYTNSRVTPRGSCATGILLRKYPCGIELGADWTARCNVASKSGDSEV